MGKEVQMFAALTSRLAKTAIGGAVVAGVATAAATYRIKTNEKDEQGKTALQLAAKSIGSVAKTVTKGLGSVSKQVKDGFQEGYSK